MNEREREFKPFIEKKEEEMKEVEFVEEKAREIEPKILESREHLHSHPELGLAPETAKCIAEKLKKLGLEVKEGIADTGIVATLKGQRERPCIIFKVSLDALPVEDESPKTPRSKVKGVSHACGHDVAMAYLLGCAEILTKIPERKGSVKFLFQPNEERAVIQESYAKKMTIEGAAKKADAIFELHPVAVPEERALCPEGRMNAASGRYKVMVHPKEQEVLEGRTPDANTLLSLITARMGRHEPWPEQLKDVLIRTPFHIGKEKKMLKEVAEEFGISPREFVSLKITLRGPGGHAGAAHEAPNLNLFASEIVSRLYEKYGNALLSFSESIGKPAYNILTTQTELWLTLRAKEKIKEFRDDVDKLITDLPIEKEWREEQFDKVPFASEAESWSTIRIGQTDYLGPRKDIFSELVEVVRAEMEKAGLRKPKVVKRVGERMPCPKGEWRLYYQKGTPPQFNNPELVRIFDESAQAFGVKDLEKRPLTSGTDFCYFSAIEKIPSAQVLLGSVTEKDFIEKLGGKLTGHTTKVEFTHESILRGAKILALLAQKFWERKIVEKP